MLDVDKALWGCMHWRHMKKVLCGRSLLQKIICYFLHLCAVLFLESQFCAEEKYLEDSVLWDDVAWPRTGLRYLQSVSVLLVEDNTKYFDIFKTNRVSASLRAPEMALFYSPARKCIIQLSPVLVPTSNVMWLDKDFVHRYVYSEPDVPIYTWV